jgi:hypothetical protein
MGWRMFVDGVEDVVDGAEDVTDKSVAPVFMWY